MRLATPKVASKAAAAGKSAAELKAEAAAAGKLAAEAAAGKAKAADGKPKAADGKTKAAMKGSAGMVSKFAVPGLQMAETRLLNMLSHIHPPYTTCDARVDGMSC